MADPKDTWNQEQTERIETWLTEKWGTQRKCPMCDAFQWHIAEPGSLPLGLPDGSILLGPGFPAVVVVCGNCGHFVLVSAYLCGAIEKPTAGEGSNG